MYRGAAGQNGAVPFLYISPPALHPLACPWRNAQHGGRAGLHPFPPAVQDGSCASVNQTQCQGSLVLTLNSHTSVESSISNTDLKIMKSEFLRCINDPSLFFYIV